jgi:hypothetical protein
VDATQIGATPWHKPCSRCGKPTFQDLLDERNLCDYAAEFKDTRPVAAPSLQGYVSALSTPVLDDRKDRYLRLRAWWAGNDPRRQTEHAGSMSDGEIANLRAFLPLLDDADDNDRIMKAEILRELGMFAEAGSLLLSPFRDDLGHAVAIINDLTEQRVSTVKEMKFK